MPDPTLSEYAGDLAPAGYDRTEASTRRKVIEAALFDSSLRVTSMFESGSWTHGTSIKAKSDVDYMAVAVGPRPAWPSSALAAAKTAVKGCDWKITDVRVSSPVIGITYYRQPDFEVAPAWYKERFNGFDVYWIGGRGDEWVLSAPGAHLSYVNQQNDRLGKKVKPLVRLLKAWKHNAGAPVSSFYLEMRTAEYAADETVIIYDVDLRRMMNDVLAHGARDMNDPARIVGRIPACGSDEKRRRTLGMLRTAISYLRAADEAKTAGDRMGYWLAMRSVFGDELPVADVVTSDSAAWREAADEELRQLIDDMLHTEKTHLAAAERLQGLHLWLGIAATVMATGAAATIVAALSEVAAGLLALGAAIVSGVLTFMKPERIAEQHLAAGRQLAALRVQARQVLNLDLPSARIRRASQGHQRHRL